MDDAFYDQCMWSDCPTYVERLPNVCGAIVQRIWSNCPTYGERLPNVCGAIVGTHIPLTKHPSKRVNLAGSDFYNRKKFHSIVLQGVCDANKISKIFVGLARWSSRWWLVQSVQFIQRCKEPRHLVGIGDGDERYEMYPVFDCKLYLSYTHLFDEELEST